MFSNGKKHRPNINDCSTKPKLQINIYSLFQQDNAYYA